VNGYSRRPVISPASEMARPRPHRKGSRVIGPWRLDVTHPNHATTEVTVEAVWRDGDPKRMARRLHLSLRDSSLPRLALRAAVEPCGCCARPLVVSYKIADGAADIRNTLTADSRLLLGALAYRVADEFGLLPENEPQPDGEAKATQP
jgi:hypothetical protein